MPRPSRPIALTDAVAPRRRRFLGQAGALLAAFTLTPRLGRAQGAAFVAVRAWPAEDYTRITLEASQPLHFEYQFVPDPDRLVIDLPGMSLDEVLKSLPGKITADDPYIQGVRLGQFRPDVVRVVIDLKQKAEPQIFTLDPVAQYRHRLVIDVYPQTPRDPIQALLAELSNKHGASSTVGTPQLSETPDIPPGASPSPPAKSRTPASAPYVIVIDPGHGGEDPGAIGRLGSREKDVTLAIARRLKRILDAQPKLRCALTRNGDYFVPLGERVRRARAAQADLFVSIHADAVVSSSPRGSSVYVLSDRGASSTTARWLANKENQADLIGGVNLGQKNEHVAKTLLDLSLTATLQDSAKLGRHLLTSLGEINPLHKRDIEYANFAVLRNPDVPAVLIETAFISNPQEERRLNDPAYQERLAQAIYKGLQRYLEAAAPTPRLLMAARDGKG
ncbi:MAG: N-acetylmuramoyl-L-alanine amidase [Rhodocyclales bacterium]|nr:N-acetylmuramoyl-L-alanine amidase [Rhodocyclales bacterium]